MDSQHQQQQQQQLETDVSNHIENPNSVLRFIRQVSTTVPNASQESVTHSKSAVTNGPVACSTTGRRPTYAQWISKAIASSIGKALTLADINEWMIRNVPGLQEQRYLHSCKGWKNAVRHTLSINRHRFKKVSRDGKPSLWCLINEDDSFSSIATVATGNDARFHDDHVIASSGSPPSSPDEQRKKSPVVVVAKQHNNERLINSPENLVSGEMTVNRSPKRESSIETVDMSKTKYARMNSSEPMTTRQQHTQTPVNTNNTVNDNSGKTTQTLDVLYADGVLGKIILPMPLPINGLNFSGLLLNSATAALNPMSQQQCHWPPFNANNNNSSNLAFLQHMMQLSAASPNVAPNSNLNLLWDLIGLGEIKNKNFVV